MQADMANICVCILTLPMCNHQYNTLICEKMFSDMLWKLYRHALLCVYFGLEVLRLGMIPLNEVMQVLSLILEIIGVKGHCFCSACGCEENAATIDSL